MENKKTIKRFKIASIELGLRGWIPASKVQIIGQELDSKPHGSHSDKVLASRETEALVECPVEGVKWVPKETKLPTHDVPLAKPPATPESLTETSAKDCPDCHGNFMGAENEKCPTCGRFAVKADQTCPVCKKPATDVKRYDIGEGDTGTSYNHGKSWYEGNYHFVRDSNKEALKTALPPVLPNQRGYLDNPPVDKTAEEEQSEDDVFIQSEGPLGSETVAYCLRKPIAKLKNGDWNQFYMDIASWMHDHGYYPNVWQVSDHGNVNLDTDWIEYTKSDPYEKFSSLNKSAIIVKEKGKWCVRSPKNKNWNGGCYSSRGAAEKRLKEVEVFKHMKGGTNKPFSKKAAEILTDPYQALQTQVQTLRDRMSLVQERLQSNPLPKEAGNGEKDNSEMDIPTLLEDLTMGIDLLETKLQGDKVEEDVHPAIEEMENLLWSVEEKLGITPHLSEEEKAEPEHKDIVKDLDKEAASPLCSVEGCENKADSVSNGKRYCYTHSWGKKNLKEATTTPTSPVSPSSPVSPGTATSTPTTPTDADKPTCALCGGMQFSDFAKYQNHMEYTHSSDTMPTSPSQKNLPTTVGSKKKAADVTLTDESIEDKLTNPPVTDSTNQLMPVPPVPTPQNVQPTDNDNLEISIPAPTSPLPQGQKWVFDTENNVYVAMPDPASPGKTI